jgi:hypothetical protein
VSGTLALVVAAASAVALPALLDYDPQAGSWQSLMDREHDAVDRAHEAAAEASEVITRARELRVIARVICGISQRLRAEIRRQQGITPIGSARQIS